MELSLDQKSSWHDEYKDSAYIFIGGLDYDLTEGDVLAVFSQYGEVVNINLVKDKRTKKSKGFCFLAYEDQRSTVLAVDNLNGIKVAGRALRVDHVKQYRRPRDENGNEIIEKGCAPKTPTPSPSPERSPSPVKTKKEKKKHKKRDSLSADSDDSGSSPKVKRKRKHSSLSPEIKRKKKHKEKKKEKKLAKQKEEKTVKPRVPEIPHLASQQLSTSSSYLLYPKTQSDLGAMKKPDGKNPDNPTATKEEKEKQKFQLGGFFDANNPFGSTQPKRTYDYRYDFGRDSYKPTRYQ